MNYEKLKKRLKNLNNNQDNNQDNFNRLKERLNKLNGNTVLNKTYKNVKLKRKFENDYNQLLDLILIIHTELRDAALNDLLYALRVNRIERVLKIQSWYADKSTVDQVRKRIELLKEENYFTQPKYSEFLKY